MFGARGPLFLLSFWRLCSAQDSAVAQDGTIVNDTYFYGQSPPVYPTPQGDGRSGWQEAYTKAAALVAQMTTEEKVNVTSGFSDSTNGCVGNTPPVSRLNFPGLCLSDGPIGLRDTDFVNGYASGISVGASWNRDLSAARGYYMGQEFKTKGSNLINGPVVGPLGRITTGGRNWEGFTNDPYLDGQLGAANIQGTQKAGVITSTKHFILNEQELNRLPSSSNGTAVESVSSNTDDKTLHELYLWPFADAVHAGSGSVMCSYQRANNSHSCQNSKLLNGILKTELGFQGFVLSDWSATQSGVASALAGLDMEMPTGTYFGTQLVEAVNNGSVPESRLDDMATRIIAAWYQMGQDQDFPARGVGIPNDVTLPHPIVNAKSPASKPTIFQGAVEGHVLVKNTNNALPLKKPQLLSIFGYDAAAPQRVDPVRSSLSNYLPLGETLVWGLGVESVNLTAFFNAYAGAIANEADPPSPQTQIASEGTLMFGGGSGAATPAYFSAPFDALSQRAYEDDTSLYWDLIGQDSQASAASVSDACLVFINAFSTEDIDRIGTHDDYSDALVTNVAAQCNNTIVVIHNAGTRLVDQFADNPNVTAIIFAHLPGQDSGRAIVSLLYGDSNFSGKMPYTVAKNESAYGDLYFHATRSEDAMFALFPQSNFTEGLYIDYKAFDAFNVTPRYEFGFGLSYTSFSLANLQITKAASGNFGPYPLGTVEQGGHADLWDNVAYVTVDVTNTGSVNGAEVAQLYVGIPDGPKRQLRGFEKPVLDPGQMATIQFPLTRRDLSVWDTGAQQWLLQQSAEYTIYVGNSSRNLPLTGTLNLSSS